MLCVENLKYELEESSQMAGEGGDANYGAWSLDRRVS